MSTMYGSPEDFALTTVGEIDWSDGCYVFDLTVVWRRNIDGKFVYADDSGCSCPSPFEDIGVEELTLCTPAELQAHLEKRAADAYTDYSDQRDRWGMEIANLMGRVVM